MLKLMLTKKFSALRIINISLYDNPNENVNPLSAHAHKMKESSVENVVVQSSCQM